MGRARIFYKVLAHPAVPAISALKGAPVLEFIFLSTYLERPCFMDCYNLWTPYELASQKPSCPLLTVVHESWTITNYGQTKYNR